MSYKWVLSGIVEKPTYIPAEYFICQNANGYHRPNHFPPGRILAFGDVVPFMQDGLYISKANFETSQLEGVVLADENGNIVGTYHYNWIHFIPKYRGRKLAIEFMAEGIQANIHRFNDKKGATQSHLNEAGAYIFEQVHQLLLSRGAITHEAQT